MVFTNRLKAMRWRQGKNDKFIEVVLRELYEGSNLQVS